jgi:hypothetical protein
MQKSLRFALATALILAGCKDLDEFSTKSDESYCGRIVSTSIVRTADLSEKMCMRMTFNTQHASDSPGALWTNDGMFLASPLRAMPQLSNDPLLLFSFGDGREKNFLFAVDPADPARGPSVTAVVSLMHSRGAEVRLFRGAPGGTAVSQVPEGGSGCEAPPLFGVFAPLERKSGSCSSEPDCNWMPE